MKKKTKLIVIVGPTASGKSDLAIAIAKKIGGEIISADSRQIYRGLDIGTGKITAKEMRGVPHYCLDIVSPKKQYSVAEYAERATRAIKDIQHRGKIPILAGGTGFWIDAVVYNMQLPNVPPNKKLRTQLEKKSSAILLRMLKNLDPDRAKTIEQKNPRRLIRAIEIARAIGKTPRLQKKSPYNVCWIGIARTSDELKKRIHARLKKRLRQGMIAEAKHLREKGLPWKRFYELGLEYRYLADFLRGTVSKKEMMEQLERAIIRYSKRQITWWRRNPDIHWIQNAEEGKKLVKRLF